MRCSMILIKLFTLICCILTIEASITNYFFRPNENISDLADNLKSGQEILKLRLDVVELNLNKENQTVNEIERKLQNLEEILKQQQDALKEMVTNRNVLISADLPMETSSTKSADTANSTDCLEKPNAADTVFFTDILKKDEPTVCKLNADGISECSLLTLPTTCENFRSINCVNNKCRVRNRIYGEKSFWVSCSGEWTVIQRRINGSVNFYRNWSDYKRGFGDLDGELWIGLDKLHSLTKISGPVQLYIQLQDFHNVTRYAIYESFSIGNESTGYQMTDPRKYSGDAGDSFYPSKDELFCTYDRDNDKRDGGHCAELRQGGWWYWNCDLSQNLSNLNGHYYQGGVVPNYKPGSGIYWKTFGGHNQSLKFVEMKIRLKYN